MRDIDKFRPLNGYLLIEVLDEVQKMQGSILLPETSGKERGNIAKVVKVSYTDDGSGSLVEIGDKIMFSKYSGTVIQSKLDTVEYRLIKETDVLGKFDD